MRLLIHFLIAAAFIFMLPGSLHANVNGVPLVSIPPQSLLMETLDTPHPDILKEIIFMPEAPFNHIEAAGMIERIGSLPETMLQRIKEQGIQIVLFKGKLTDNPSAQALKGKVPRGYKTDKTWDDVPGAGGSKIVLVKIGSSHKGMGHGSVNLELHELAHSLDRHVYELIREDPAFLEIWKRERTFLFPGKDYFLDYPEEYFAECFAYYYIGGDFKALLGELAPETYTFIQGLK